MTTPDEAKAVARRWNDEVWGARNLDVIPELIADEAVLRDASLPEPLHGPEGARGFVVMMLGAFPDTQVEINRMVAEGDLIAAHFTARGTHQGTFQGIEPTGRQIEVTGIALRRIREGKVVEEWQIFDALGMLRQLGAIPG